MKDETQPRAVVLFADSLARYQDWAPHLEAAFAARGLDVEMTTDRARTDVDFIVYAPDGAIEDFGAYPALRAVFSMWAGVEKIVDNPTLRVPLTRMVEPGLSEGMAEWVLGHVMRHHLGMDQHLQDGVWRGLSVAPLARERRVGILGLGTLGQMAARLLVPVGFRVLGWSRSEKTVDGVETYSGDAGLDAVLAASDILVLLLPQTPETDGLMNAARLARLPKGASLINPGRGPLIVDAELLAAFDRGHLSRATLDVFDEEPLPADHPYWAHPNIMVTPHIAAATRPETAAPVIAENLYRAVTGAPLLHLVDRNAGY